MSEMVILQQIVLCFVVFSFILYKRARKQLDVFSLAVLSGYVFVYEQVKLFCCSFLYRYHIHSRLKHAKLFEVHSVFSR